MRTAGSALDRLSTTWKPSFFYRQSGVETSEYIEKRMVRKSEYAHSKTLHEDQQTAAGESEQGVPLMTVQDISELSETDIIGTHRNLKPFRAKRMDWRQFPNLAIRTKIPSPQLPRTWKFHSFRKVWVFRYGCLTLRG
jgi:type IV secretory pathway TraG/TraD family ATPase VirD4